MTGRWAMCVLALALTSCGSVGGDGCIELSRSGTFEVLEVEELGWESATIELNGSQMVLTFVQDGVERQVVYED